MLEESIRNHEKGNPAEIALAMLSFIQSELPAGGTAAETRFLNLFLPLCDCIFGPIDLTNYRHRDGGWMSASKPWPRLSPTANGAPLHATSGKPKSNVPLPESTTMKLTYSFDSDPVVKLLGMAGKPPFGSEPLPHTLIEAISKESVHRPSVTFPLKFHALPMPLQESWLFLIKQASSVLSGNRMLTSSTTGRVQLFTDNDIYLLELLRQGPNEQNQLQLFSLRCASMNNLTQPDFLRQKSVLHRPQQPYLDMKYSTSNTPSNVTSTQSPSFTPLLSSTQPLRENSVEVQIESPDLMLSMLEYYLFVFFRFPLAVPETPKAGMSATIPGVHVHRIPPALSDVGAGRPPYSVQRSSSRETFGETLYHHIFRRCMRHFLPYEVEENRCIAFGDTQQFSESELFLRTCIAMWLESRSRLIVTEAMVELIVERRRRTSGVVLDSPALLAAAPVFDLSASYDLTHTVVKYDPLPPQLHKCLRTLIIHAILDPSVRQLVSERQRSPSNVTSSKLCLSRCLTVLQQPVYNYIRATFRFAPIHSTSESSFYGAMNIWLLWLEPWNASQCAYKNVVKNFFLCTDPSNIFNLSFVN